MEELIAQLKRIAEALEEQNRVYLQRCAEVDEKDREYEQRRFQHDFEVIDAQHAQAKERLEREHRNLVLVHRIYAEHPELAKVQVAAHGDEYQDEPVYHSSQVEGEEQGVRVIHRYRHHIEV